MGKSHLIARIGSKTNDIKYFNHLLPLDVKKVVEPFGGSFAVIRDVYTDNKYKKYVNDNDEILNHIYNKLDDLKIGYEKWNVIYNMDINYNDQSIVPNWGTENSGWISITPIGHDTTDITIIY